MPPRYGLIGGTTLPDVGDHDLRVATPWGPATLSYAETPAMEVVALDRHATEEGRVPAHRVPHRRNLSALRRAGVDACLAIHTVGALDPGLETGALAAPTGLVDATGAPPTVHDEAVVHVDVDPPFCPRVHGRLTGLEAVAPAGAYVETHGPRFETPQEVRLLREAGDVVGMTAASEATVARELGLCYASLAVVANPAAGLQEGGLEARDVAAAARRAADEARGAATAALEDLEDGACPCPEAPEAGRLHEPEQNPPDT